MGKGISPDRIQSAIDALTLGYHFFQRMDGMLMDRILSGPIVLEDLPTVPSWVLVEQFLELNPSALSTPALKKAWKQRHDSPVAQMELIAEFQKEFDRSRPVTLVHPSIEGADDLKNFLSEYGADIIKVVGDQKYSDREKREKLFQLLTHEVEA
jgi:hypothetical protein